MPNRPPRYTDRESLTRLLLLSIAIAQNPGIANSRDARKLGLNPLEVLLAKMGELAIDLNLQIPNWSIATIRKDLTCFKELGLIPKGASQAGYAIGLNPPPLPVEPRTEDAQALVDRILELHGQGLNGAAIARQLECSRQYVSKVLKN